MGRGTGNPNWKKGCKSPNPKGAPQKDESITFLMKKFLESCPEGQEKTYKQIFVEKAYAKAVKDGDVTAQKLIWNYIDGLPQGKLDLTTKGESIVPQDLEEQIEKVLQKYGSRKETSGEKGSG